MYYGEWCLDNWAVLILDMLWCSDRVHLLSDLSQQLLGGAIPYEWCHRVGVITTRR